MEYSSLHPQLLLLGLPQVQGHSPGPATLREVAQIDPDMMKRTMLDMRERAVKCIAAGEGRFEKKSSNQLYPCLVTDRSLMRS